MQTLKEWLASPELKELKALTPGELYTKAFFRDPLRAIYIDPTVFYSPADGVVLYAQEVQPGEPIPNPDIFCSANRCHGHANAFQ